MITSANQCRLYERQPTQVSVTLQDSPTAMRVAVSASNLLVGHALLLRLAALAGAGDESVDQQQLQQQQQQQQPQQQRGEELQEEAGATARDAVESQPGSVPVSARQAAGQQQPAAAADGPPSLGASGDGAVSNSSCPASQRHQQQLDVAAASPAASTLNVSSQAGSSRGSGSAALPPAAADAAAVQAVPPAKPVLTSVQLDDCRVVLRYQPALHPAGGVSGIPAATHDFLSVHHDLLALDVPLLRLQLPLDPTAVAQAALAVSDCAAAAAHEAAAAAAGAATSEASPTSLGASPGSQAAPSPFQTALPQHQAWGEQQQPQQQMLVDASRVALMAAAVGYARHAMLPLLQLPSLQLVCRASCSSSSSQNGPLAPAPSPPTAAPSVADVTVSYQLQLPCVDLGLHPSQLSMLTSALQLCQHELELLGREPPGTAGDAEGTGTSASGAWEQHGQGQQHTVATHRSSATDVPAAATEPVSARSQHEVSTTGSSPRLDAGAALEAASGGTPEPAASLCQPSPGWHVEAAIGFFAVSLLGATPSSSCLKLEWHGLAAATGTAASSSAAARPPEELQLSWRHLAVYVMHPRLTYTHPAITPFAVAAGLLAADGRRRGSSVAMQGGSPGGGSPHSFRHQLPGAPTATGGPPPASEVLFQRVRGPLSASGAGTGGVRRNLSVGLGLAGTHVSVIVCMFNAGLALLPAVCSHVIPASVGTCRCRCGRRHIYSRPQFWRRRRR